MIDAIAALANRFWRIHPNEIPLGITREQFYEREMRALFTTQATARIEQLETALLGIIKMCDVRIHRLSRFDDFQHHDRETLNTHGSPEE